MKKALPAHGYNRETPRTKRKGETKTVPPFSYWSIFSLKGLAFQILRSAVSRKCRGFSLALGRAALSAASRFTIFKTKRLYCGRVAAASGALPGAT